MIQQEVRYVLDSSALLAHLQDEPSAGHVQGILRQAAEDRARLFLCVINLAEVLYLTERRFGLEAARNTLAAIQHDLPIELVPANELLSIEAAHLKAAHPISLADCYVAALAQTSGAAILTSDPDFARLGDAVKVEWL